MDPGATVDERREKWTSAAPARAPRERDSAADLMEAVNGSSLALGSVVKDSDYERDNLHILRTDLKERSII